MGKMAGTIHQLDRFKSRRKGMTGIKRSVVFTNDTGKAQKRMELLYGAVINGGAFQAQQGAGRGIEVVRREARILDKLDAVSVVNPDPSAPKGYTDEARLVTDDAVMVLDQADFDLLKKRIEETPWLPSVSRSVVDTIDWLSASSEVKEDA